MAIDYCGSGLVVCFERGMAGGSEAMPRSGFQGWCDEHAVMVEVCVSQHLMCVWGSKRNVF